MPTSELIHYLPAIFQEYLLLDQFLLAFERILLGGTNLPVEPPDSDLANYPGLEENISDLARYFDPQRTPAEFLPWLSSWVALALRADLDEKQQREFLSRIVALYGRRGTLDNLKELLKIFTGGEPTITETVASEFQIGVNSTLNVDTVLEGGIPHFFTVTLGLSTGTPAEKIRQVAIATALIDLEKPAHTDYKLFSVFPSMQIGINSRVGIDTLLGIVAQP